MYKSCYLMASTYWMPLRLTRFCAAALYAEHELSVELVTAEGSRAVASGVNGLTIEASGKLNPECAGIILVPGASGEVDGDGPDSIPAILPGNEYRIDRYDRAGARPKGHHSRYRMRRLAAAGHERAVGRRSAVTHHLGMGLLGATGAVPIKARVVDDGSLVTGGGVTSGLDVALYLVERELGPRIAHAVEQLFEYERRGTVWKGIGLAPSIQKALPDDNEPTAATNHRVLTNAASSHQLTQASMFEGDWDTVIATPVGKMEVRLSISAKNDMIEGTATQGDETIHSGAPCSRAASWSGRFPSLSPCA